MGSHRLGSSETRLALLLLCAAGTLHAQLASECGAANESTVRLVGDERPYCGRLEVCHEGLWGTICDDSFDSRDANVVCKMMGYERHLTRHPRAQFGEGTGRIWLDNMRCAASHTHISQCTPLRWGRHNCEHDEDMGVCCKRKEAEKPAELPVRLGTLSGQQAPMIKCPDKFHPDGANSVQGVVEVKVNGVWGRISALYWTYNEAIVACGELGYPLAEQLTDEIIELDSGSGDMFLRLYSPKNNNTYLHELECTGKERDILSCFFSRLDAVPNPTGRVAALRCGCKPYPPLGNTTLRLKSGPVPWKGRLEVLKDGAWGTVCDTRFDALDGNVVCRELGYGSVETVFTRASMGQGVGKIHFSNCRCTGTEELFLDCPCTEGRDVDRYCDHVHDVGVLCKVPKLNYTTEHMQLAEFAYPDPRAPWIYHHYMELYLRPPNLQRSEHVELASALRKGLVCRPAMTIASGEVFCREMKGMFLSQLAKGDLPTGYSGVFYDGLINCTGMELSLSDCTVKMRPVEQCSEGYVMIECNPGAPDLVLDIDQLELSIRSRHYLDRLPLYYLQCAQEEGCLSVSSSASGVDLNNERLLLRFDSMSWNYGTADFRPASPVQDWEWHSCHNHYHSIEEFVHYDLFSADTGAKVAEGHKASFCLEDSLCSGYAYSRYRCAYHIQGISIGCADLYGSHLDCQWIDVTGIVTGEYVLQIHLNPGRAVVESDYSNNVVKCGVTVSESRSAFTYEVNYCCISC